MPAVVKKLSTPSAETQIYSFTPIANNETTGSIFVNCADRATVQALGTFASASVSLQGSLNNVDWVILTDPLGNALTFSAAGLKEIGGVPPYIRAFANNAGGGTTSMTLLVATRD